MEHRLMTYRDHLILSVQNLIETEQILFGSALNLCMFGELENLDTAFEADDQFTFKLELLKSVEDLSVKKIVEVIDLIQDNAEYIINVNKITQEELDHEYNF